MGLVRAVACTDQGVEVRELRHNLQGSLFGNSVTVLEQQQKADLSFFLDSNLVCWWSLYLSIENT